MKRSSLDNVARALVVFGAAFSLWIIVASYRLGETSFLGFAFVGLILLHLSLRPRWLEAVLTAAIGGFYLAQYRLLGGPLSGGLAFGTVGVLAFAGTGSLLVMVARLLWSSGTEQKSRLRLLLAGLTPIAFLVYTPVVLRLIHLTAPQSLDHFLYAFDARFGFQAGFAAGQLFDRVAALRTVCGLVYLGLPLAMAVVYVLVPDGCGEPNLIKTFFLMGVAAVALFQIVPAAGPVYAFTDVYPASPPSAGPGFLVPMRMDGAKFNAIPSLHAAWALLIFWRAWRGKTVVRTSGAAFLFFTLLATLGLGEHYLIDLVVAVPYAVVIRAACLPERWTAMRWGIATTNACAVAAWLIALRSAILVSSPAALAWTLALVTVAGSLWSNARLASATTVRPSFDPAAAAEIVPVEVRS